jgi:DNA methylase
VIATIYVSDPATTLHVGDARDVLATMPAGLADCIVTSPPYWAKRDYGMAAQYSHEPSPAAYVETLRTVFREARRVLADDGTCWLNLGDSYSVGGATPSGLHSYLGRGLAGRNAYGMGTKNLLGLPGAPRSHSRTTAGSSATPSSGTSPTPCPNQCATASTAGTK